MKKILPAVLLIAFMACNNSNNTDDKSGNAEPSTTPATMTYTVVNVHPHDTSSYTQGFEWHNNVLYEGTGMRGQSLLRKENLQDGKPLQETKITDPAIFGEGITVFNNKIYQLSWQEHKVFVYDLASFKKLEELKWQFDGWGLTNDGKNLIVSTGSSNLYYVNPDDFKISKTVGVTDNNGPVADINELEYVDGKIYANIYMTNYIVKINPETGRVESRADLSHILDKNNVPYDHAMINDTSDNVLNGIAYNGEKKIFYITGKRWPAVFEVKFN